MPSITEHSIAGRQREHDVEMAAFGHFTLSDGPQIPLDALNDTPGWSLYCLDRERRDALFLKLPPAIDLERATFAYDVQFREAVAAALVPFAALDALAKARNVPENLILVFSIGRCGSTLVSRILSSCDDIWSLSEPDSLTNLARARADYTKQELDTLIPAAIRLSYAPLPRTRHNSLAIKPRSQALFQAEAYVRAFPGATLLFLYREPDSWAESYFRIGLRLGLLGDATSRDLRLKVWRNITAMTDVSYLRPFLDPDADEIHVEEIFAAMWFLHMEGFLTLRANNPQIQAIAYEDLKSQPLATARRLLAICGQSDPDVTALEQILAKDSQGDSVMGNRKAVRGFTAEERARLRAALTRHPTRDPDDLLRDLAGTQPA